MPPDHSSPLTFELPSLASTVSVTGTPRSVPGDAGAGVPQPADLSDHASLPRRLRLAPSQPSKVPSCTGDQAVVTSEFLISLHEFLMCLTILNTQLNDGYKCSKDGYKHHAKLLD